VEGGDPAALPLILTGLQFSAVNAVANTAIAAYVSFGGLGRYIIDGLATTDYGQVAGGSVLIVVAAVLNLLFLRGAAPRARLPRHPPTELNPGRPMRKTAPPARSCPPPPSRWPRAAAGTR